MTASHILDVFVAARARIANPERHARGAAARSDTGELVDVASPNATCWCMLGAVLLECAGDMVRYADCVGVLSDKIPDGGWIAGFNDMRPHEEIVRLLDSIIADQRGGVRPRGKRS
jgi:hypothetical protein